MFCWFNHRDLISPRPLNLPPFFFFFFAVKKISGANLVTGSKSMWFNNIFIANKTATRLAKKLSKTYPGLSFPYISTTHIIRGGFRDSFDGGEGSDMEQFSIMDETNCSPKAVLVYACRSVNLVFFSFSVLSRTVMYSYWLPSLPDPLFENIISHYLSSAYSMFF